MPVVNDVSSRSSSMLAQADTVSSPDIPDTSSSPPPSTSNPFEAFVWRNENRVSSDGNVTTTILTGLAEGASDLYGKWAKVKGQTLLNGVFKWATCKESSAAKPCVTSDGFDQVQLYTALTKVPTVLIEDGFPMEDIIGKPHGGEFHAFVARANEVPDCNAWCDTQAETLTFGTCEDKWHTASDKDVVTHEDGHMILHHQNRGLSDWAAIEGGAIHEGYGDPLAAFINGNPVISEDFSTVLGQKDDKSKGLRTIDNNKTLKDVGYEVHDRGEVYGGFIWSIKKRIESKFGKSEAEAITIARRILVNHPTFYKTGQPQSDDFVKAIVSGTEALDGANKLLGVPLDQLVKEIAEEGFARGMIKNVSDIEIKPPKMEPVPLPDEVILEYNRKNPNITFTLEQTSRAIGGKREFYQEWYRLPDGRQVRVHGAGFFVHHYNKGNRTEVTRGDVRVIRDGELNARIGAQQVDVAKSVRDAVQAELRAAQAASNKFNLRADKKSRLALKAAQMKLRIAKEAEKRMGLGVVPQKSQMVVLPGEKDIFYEFKMGLSLYYVNASNGKTQVKNDLFWD